METQKPSPPQPPQSQHYQNSASRSSSMKMTIQPLQLSDNDRSSSELRALDCNLTSLCDHIQIEGFNSGAFSDVIVLAMGSTYHLHRLILSRSPYFRNMLHGPWKEASSPTVKLHIDDNNVNGEAIAMALAYLYGHQPKLNDNNAFRVLAAASFLDLQDLCAICTDHIISELWTSNFLVYQVFAESQDYGIHGERVRNACWGYLCQSGAMELKEVLPKLSSQTLHALLTSNKLWIPSEEKRFELALYTLLAKYAHCKQENRDLESESEAEIIALSESSTSKGKNPTDSFGDKRLESERGIVSPKDGCIEGPNSDIIPELRDLSHPPSKSENVSSLCSSFSNILQTSHSYPEVPVGVALEGPSDEGSCFHLNDNAWLPRQEYSGSSSNELIASDWGIYATVPSLSWSGGSVSVRQDKEVQAHANIGVSGEDYDGFVSIFEGGSMLYCNMSFEALLAVRKQLEELGFPCKAVNDGLWLQMLLSQRVQEIVADSCKDCCFVNTSCVCRQQFGFSHGVSSSGYYLQDHNHDQTCPPISTVGNLYISEPSPNEPNSTTNGSFRPVRVHARSPAEGLAGLGRGTAPTRFVFSRVPLGIGNRNNNCQQSLANDDSETSVDLPGDGLTALVGLSQESGSKEVTERGYEASVSDPPGSGGVSVPVIQSSQHWESTSNGSSISLDLKTPLSYFPPFRFGIQFENVHRLGDGQVKHSPEAFYAGSFWKVSVQAFNDEDPQGRRTLGLFIHRRKAEFTDSLRKVNMYIDSREKVTARYQLICASKREVMAFGSLKQAGTLLPKAPKGWGWRTALLFDELPDLLQNGALRIAAVVHLV